MRDADLHLPQAFAGALAVLVLLVAAFISTPAAAAGAASPPAADTRPAR